MLTEDKDDYRPSPMPAKSPFEQVAQRMNKDNNVWEKLLYWVIFKTAYHVGFVYYFIKGAIMRRW